ARKKNPIGEFQGGHGIELGVIEEIRDEDRGYIEDLSGWDCREFLVRNDQIRLEAANQLCGENRHLGDGAGIGQADVDQRKAEFLKGVGSFGVRDDSYLGVRPDAPQSANDLDVRNGMAPTPAAGEE